MPAYDYECECGEVVEKIFPMTKQAKRVKCPKCGKMAKRTITVPNGIVRHRLMETARKGRGRGY
jgi:putative FmdB family regulatory protein